MPPASPPPGAAVPRPPHGLDAEQRDTYRELYRLDPHLAGLLALGLGLLGEIEEPGVAYLVAHAGRELSNGLMRRLSGDVRPLSDEEAAGLADDERNRAVIAPVLGLPPEHPLVSRWLRAQRALVAQAHYRAPGPDPRRVREAFESLVALLYGRVAPYFTTQGELDALLAVERPGPGDVERLRRVLLRPAQRAYFFGELAHPGWLAPLAAEGVFATPPEAVRDAGGRWRWSRWPEGAYLVRVAAAEPAAVGAVLMRIPQELRNPAVWFLVAQAAARLPLAHARPLARRVRAAFRDAEVEGGGEVLAELVVHLAELGDSEALKVARTLLEFEPTEPRPLPPPGEYRWSGAPLLRLRHLDSYWAWEVLDRVLPALERLDGLETVTVLAYRLQAAIDESARLEEERHVRVPGWSVADLDDTGETDELRAFFSVLLAGSAARVASAGTDVANGVLRLLERFADPVFDRVRLHLLAAAGEHVPVSRDLAIMQTERIDQPPVREYAALLRAQFTRASPAAQRVFRYALERGPEPRLVSHVVMGDDEDEEAIRTRVAEWQRKVLRLFRGDVTPPLAALAERLGPDPDADRDPELQRRLDEDGYAVHAGAGPLFVEQSPVDAGALARMDTAALLDFLRTWEPGPAHTSAPSAGGLGNALTEVFAVEPSRLDAGIAAAAGDLDPLYVRGIVRGVRIGLVEGREVPWDRALDVVDAVFARAGQADDEGPAWSWAAEQATGLVTDGCGEDRLPTKLADRLWESLRRWPSLAAVHVRLPALRVESARSLLSEVSISAAGLQARAVVEAVLWTGRNAGSTAARPLLSLLERLLEEGGPGGSVTCTVMGQSVPRLWEMDRAWVMENAGRLFDLPEEAGPPQPGWVGYLQAREVDDRLFADLRPWYLRFVQRVDPVNLDQLTRDGNEGTLDAAAWHVLHAAIRSVVDPADDDGLLEALFTRLPVGIVGRSWWSLWRAWTNAEAPPDADLQQGLLRLWAWRLDHLEAEPTAARTREEAAEMEWLVRMPRLPLADVIPLARRTLALAGHQGRVRPLWDRLAEFAPVDPAATLEMANDLITARLQGQYPDFRVTAVGPILRQGLQSADAATRDRARWLVHRLGDAGFVQFGELLASDPPAKDAPE